MTRIPLKRKRKAPMRRRFRRPSEGIDKFGLWRSRRWLEFVRSLPCSCRRHDCPNCSRHALGEPTPVVAAHLRSHGAMGVKPDDFLVYPLADAMHRRFHDTGQPSVEWQLDRVTEALRAGFDAGVLRCVEQKDASW